ncbi:hypothetical protein B0H10DRAFT_1940102 [Mycena sp. CBHHK59/15]|nr:hypothetical protein B0H10DRAFT_1940102 [Mycena sp. CBHHK59/15]
MKLNELVLNSELSLYYGIVLTNTCWESDVIVGEGKNVVGDQSVKIPDGVKAAALQIMSLEARGFRCIAISSADSWGLQTSGRFGETTITSYLLTGEITEHSLVGQEENMWRGSAIAGATKGAGRTSGAPGATGTGMRAGGMGSGCRGFKSRSQLVFSPQVAAHNALVLEKVMSKNIMLVKRPLGRSAQGDGGGGHVGDNHARRGEMLSGIGEVSACSMATLQPRVLEVFI